MWQAAGVPGGREGSGSASRGERAGESTELGSHIVSGAVAR